MPEFLPISRADMQRRGWEQCDFVYIIGDGYVDHPSFGHAIISRVLEDAGYKVGIISQPDWKNPASINALGEPRLGFLVMGGNMDSMVNHYTVSKAHRKTDAYTPGGVMGKRPDYAVTVYCNLIRRTYRRKPIIIGGIEASLRRLAHYDYWSDRLKRSILLDSQADLLIYGMGERAVIEIANALNDGMDAQDITYIDGTVYKTREPDTSVPSITLPAFPDMQKNPRVYAESFSIQYRNTDPFCAKRLIEPYGDHEFIVQNPPQKPLSQKEMDHVYDLPYCRTFHPSYKKLGGIPAIAEIEFSLTSCRGCFGALQLLCADVPSGADHPDPLAGVDHQGSRGHDAFAGLQGLYPRCRRPDGEFPPARLQKAAPARRVPDKTVPVPLPLQKPDRRPHGLPVPAAEAPQAAGRQEGLHPQRHPVRLSAGRPERYVLQGAGATIIFPAS